MNPQTIARLTAGGLLLFWLVLLGTSATYVVQPGYRGVLVTMGHVSPAFKPEGFGLKLPWVSQIHPISVRQQTAEEKAECYSADLQQIQVELRVLFRIPESSVVGLFQRYYGDPFESLVSPRVQESIKEATALQSAEQVVKTRETIKVRALELARKKTAGLIVIEDIVIQNIALTKELEQAIEAKMVQEQEASKSKYLQQRAQIEADTAVIKAKGEAESIRIRGHALRENPSYIDLQIVDKWDGIAPIVIGGGNNTVLTMQDLERLSRTPANAIPSSKPTGSARPRIP
jgi:prohibitin 2